MILSCRQPLHPSSGGTAKPKLGSGFAPRAARAFSFAETLICLVVVSTLLLVSLHTVGAGKSGQQRIEEHGVGQLLGAALISEIMSLPYRDADGTVVLGVEAGESTVSRAAFDDVDDYSGWNESPPAAKDGTVIPDRTGWRRSVAVTYINPNTFVPVIHTDTGAKRITVTVTHNGREAAVYSAIRTDGPDDGLLSIDPIGLELELN